MTSVMSQSEDAGEPTYARALAVFGLCWRLIVAGLLAATGWAGFMAATMLGVFGVVLGGLGAIRGRAQRLRLIGNLAITVASILAILVAVYYRNRAEALLEHEAQRVQSACIEDGVCPESPERWDEAVLRDGPSQLVYDTSDARDRFTMSYSPGTDVSITFEGGVAVELTGSFSYAGDTRRIYPAPAQE